MCACMDQCMCVAVCSSKIMYTYCDVCFLFRLLYDIEHNKDTSINRTAYCGPNGVHTVEVSLYVLSCM